MYVESGLKPGGKHDDAPLGIRLKRASNTYISLDKRGF